MTTVLTHSPRVTTLLPFALWTPHSAEADLLAKVDLPNLRAWLMQAQRVHVQIDDDCEPLLATLSPPHECAWAEAVGWPVVDGGLPWAAHAARQAGLITEHNASLATGWAFITLCHWQVSQGQVILGDPTQLHIDAATDATLFQAMQRFFAEDGIVLHPYKPGQWLAQSSWFVDLPTASLDRVMGRNIDPWLVGSHSTQALSPAAQVLRRLQNEMQMLLYTHPVNEGCRLSINSFWLHGTGRLPTSESNQPAPTMVETLRNSALQQDFMGWLEAWHHIDAQVMAPLLEQLAAGQPQRLVLCGEHVFHVYDTAQSSWWQSLRHRLAPTSLDRVLTLAPLKD